MLADVMAVQGVTKAAEMARRDWVFVGDLVSNRGGEDSFVLVEDSRSVLRRLGLLDDWV